MKKITYNLYVGEKFIGTEPTLALLAKLAGCSRAWLYKTINGNQFTVKKITYTISVNFK